MKKEINKVSVETMNVHFNPCTISGYGELILSYLKIEEEGDLLGIIDINDREELWTLEDGMFESILMTDKAKTEKMSIGSLDFGKLSIGGKKLLAVIEQNASPMIIYINKKDINLLRVKVAK